MKLIYHDETEPVSYEKVRSRYRQGYGIEHPEKISGFAGAFFRLPDIYVYGRLEKWLENNEGLEDELKKFIDRFRAEDYGFVSRDEQEGNDENRWLCGSCDRSIGRYSFGKDYDQFGGVVLEFFDGIGFFYSVEEDMSAQEIRRRTDHKQ